MKRTMTKKDVAKRTAKIVGERLSLTEKIVDGVFQALRELMSEADPEVRIEIRDFGVFEVKTTKPKPKARNPKTGEIIYVPARRKTHFKAGKLLKEVLKQPLAPEVAAATPSEEVGARAQPETAEASEGQETLPS